MPPPDAEPALTEARAGMAEKMCHKQLCANQLMGNGVMVARLTLDQLVEVRVLIPQFDCISGF